MQVFMLILTLYTGFKRLWLIALTLIVISLPLHSQNLKKDMEAMSAIYQNSANLSVDIKVNVFQDRSSTPAFTQQARLDKMASSFYYDMGESKMLVSETSVIMIHEKEKDLLYRAISKKQYDNYRKSLIRSNLDSVIATYDSVHYAGIKSGQKHYVVYTGKGHIKQTDIYIDASSLHLKKITYLYNESLWGEYYKVNITFVTTSVTGINEDAFKETSYISRSGNKLKLTPQYSNYHLIEIENED